MDFGRLGVARPRSVVADATVTRNALRDCDRNVSPDCPERDTPGLEEWHDGLRAVGQGAATFAARADEHGWLAAALRQGVDPQQRRRSGVERHLLTRSEQGASLGRTRSECPPSGAQEFGARHWSIE